MTKSTTKKALVGAEAVAKTATEVIEQRGWGGNGETASDYRIPEYKPEPLSPEKLALMKDLNHFLANEGGRAYGAGLMYAIGWRALFEAGVFTEENTKEATARTAEIVRQLDRHVQTLAHQAEGLEDEDYTLTDEELAQVKAVAALVVRGSISPPPLMVQAILGHAVLLQDTASLSDFKRRARALGLDVEGISA